MVQCRTELSTNFGLFNGYIISLYFDSPGDGRFFGDVEVVGYGFKFTAHSLLILVETTYYGGCYFVSYMYMVAPSCLKNTTLLMWSTGKGMEVVRGCWERRERGGGVAGKCFLSCIRRK